MWRTPDAVCTWINIYLLHLLLFLYNTKSRIRASLYVEKDWIADILFWLYSFYFACRTYICFSSTILFLFFILPFSVRLFVIADLIVALPERRGDAVTLQRHAGRLPGGRQTSGARISTLPQPGSGKITYFIYIYMKNTFHRVKVFAQKWIPRSLINCGIFAYVMMSSSEVFSYGNEIIIEFREAIWIVEMDSLDEMVIFFSWNIACESSSDISSSINHWFRPLERET